ncbi:NAD-dependent epimerase/dehydratase family protein [Streptomyces sp. NPDC058321]|uniref:NAD-dependent epimerase/dehydratase family protein n=1 Tax=Streptomyces sp. NPDC058321 TaxID=3346445 RepID=UPI0036E2EFE1
MHSASPFTRTVQDPQRDLVDPAVHGTRNVLQTANDVDTVERVVLTSSVAAMTGDAKDIVRLPGRTVTEETWNTTSSLTREPYSFSKTLAEKEAWRIEQGQDRWSLVAINPGLVIGPALNADPTSESFSIARQMVSGQARFGAPRIAVAVVDVREVAYAHLAAAFLPKAQVSPQGPGAPPRHGGDHRHRRSRTQAPARLRGTVPTASPSCPETYR